MGDFGDGLALEGGGGATPEEALRTFLVNAVYVIPRSDYEPIGQSGDRYAYGYRNDGEVKVVIVVSPRFAHLVDAAFAADELRACPEAEFGSDATFADDRRVWTDHETGEILTDIPGPGHCGWQSARMLHVAQPDGGGLWKQYVRDPIGVFGDVSLLEAYAEGVDLPTDATDSGYRSPEGYELWFTKTDNAAYVVTPEGVERWPRADPPIGCT